MVEADFKDRGDFDEADRELCPDGNCTGLLGADGHCKVCGLGKDGSRFADKAEAGLEAELKEHADEIEREFDDRKLCPDGNCTGLLGEDGRCKVCGAS
jgi:hypothetical protein